MAKILVFNNETDRMETYYRGESEPMPYNTNGTLRVREFRGSSKSNILWTTKRCMQSWNSQRYIFGGPIPVGFAFKRPYEGGHRKPKSTLCRCCIRCRSNFIRFKKKTIMELCQ